MSRDPLGDASESDAPITTAAHQKAVAEALTEDRDWNAASMVGRTVTINRPREEIYAFWRDFRNLPRFMENIDRVEILDDQRSHWVIQAPGGRTVEWDARLTEEVPGRVLAWEAEPGADIHHSGRIQFEEAPPGRGAQVTATIIYEPPGGDVGKLIAKLFQKEPKIQARRDLRRLKQLLEAGEIAVASAPAAAPRG